jgi:hypothetical protein
MNQLFSIFSRLFGYSLNESNDDQMPYSYKAYIFLLIVVLASCKKSSDPNPAPPANTNTEIDASGTWSMYSESNASNGFSISSTQYSCLIANKLILNKDGSASRVYTGTDTCFMTKTPLVIIGMPGPGTPGTWSQTGNSVTIQIQGLSKPGLGTVSKTSTGFQLQIQDSVVNSIAVSVMTK